MLDCRLSRLGWGSTCCWSLVRSHNHNFAIDSFWNLSTEVKEIVDLYPEKLESDMEMWTWCESSSSSSSASASFWWVPYYW
jgi:hypothetical protein